MQLGDLGGYARADLSGGVDPWGLAGGITERGAPGMVVADDHRAGGLDRAIDREALMRRAADEHALAGERCGCGEEGQRGFQRGVIFFGRQDRRRADHLQGIGAGDAALPAQHRQPGE